MKNKKEKIKNNIELDYNVKIGKNDEIEELLRDCSKLIYKVDSNKKNIKNHISAELKRYFNNNDINKSLNYKNCCINYKTPGRLWILLGKNNNGKYCSLMIGQSENIRKEIEFNLNIMFDKKFDINPKDKDIHEEINLISGEPYKYKEKSKKKRYLVRALFNEYDELEFREVDIDKYLKTDIIDKIKNDLNGNTLNLIYQLSKDYFAEAKLAIETKVKYWNYYRSGVDKRTYQLLTNIIKDRLKGALYGFTIGDAMGATTEFMSEAEIKRDYGKLTDIIGGGWLNLKAGEVTDDTQMSICVMEVLMKNEFKNFKKDVADSFVTWYDTNPKDIGNQCRKAIAFYKESGNYIAEDNTALGNGSLMRALPCALLNTEKSVELNFIQGDITHNNNICRNILKEYTEILKANILGNKISFKKRVLLEPSGYIVNTFNNAIYWSEKESFEDCIIGAVNHGGDADTIAGIAGSIAGAKFGYENIPKRWVEKLDKEVVKKLEEFLEYVFKTY